MNDFDKEVARHDPEALRCVAIDTIQVNLGRVCDLACAHCHLDCSPKRSESMSRETMDLVLEAVGALEGALVDITGGAPEIHPEFRNFVSALRDLGREVLVRTNLTALLLPGSEGLMEFLREREVGLAASLPCYTEENVRAQRGEGVFEKCVEALERLNALGYAREGGPSLDLVYNPGGASLPGEQKTLEKDYRRELAKRHGIVFNKLLTIANMPVGRFREHLRREGREAAYMKTLVEGFNPATLRSLMCRHQICIDWDGHLYDCDFNLALGVTVDHGAPSGVAAFDHRLLEGRRVVTGSHCFACTAGHGSSCGGALL